MIDHPVFGRVNDDFNEAAAQEMYDLYMDDPLHARALVNMAAHQEIAKIALEEPGLIESMVIEKYMRNRELVKDAVLSGVINKSMSDGTIDAVTAVMDEVSKAFESYTEWERAADVKQQRRDVKGRFVKMGTTRITPPQGSLTDDDSMKNRQFWNAQRDAYDKVASTRGFGKPPRVMGSTARDAAHSSAYLDVAEALHRMDPTDMMMADITYTKQTRREDGSLKTEPIKRTKIGMDVNDFISPDEFASGEIPVSITWYMDSESAGAGRFNALTGAGLSTGAAFDAANMAARSGDALTGYNQKMTEYTGEYGGGRYNRIGAMAEAVDAVAGDKLGPEGQAALRAAKAIGQYGSEAEKVLGPAARRAAYRYRGTEMKPDAKLDRAIAMSVAGSRTVNDAHENLIHPKEIVDEKNMEFTAHDEHSAFIKYWQSKLPKAEYVRLHLNSGTTPPSQGVVFDAKGQVISQSVGYGDDHYLPFNLKRLAYANRGEWVRTRTMGGPTTEDIYAALTTGARSVTVVSHSGVYNVEFNDDFRGARRANDKTARMVRRYAQLLDTLDAESTTLQDIPADRKAELRAKVAGEVTGEGRGAESVRNQRLRELEEIERSNPRPSKVQQDLWTAEWGQRYAEKLGAQEERDISWEGVKANLEIRNNTGSLSDEDAITLLGGAAVESHRRFTEQKTNEYRTTQAPLKLNGTGYYFALQALQEQFPQAIKRVEFYPTDEQKTDSGYVPHRFNRPKAAKEGFWSPEIEGAQGEIKNIRGQATGKVAAHHTNYQNYAARQRSGMERGSVGNNAPIGAGAAGAGAVDAVGAGAAAAGPAAGGPALRSRVGVGGIEINSGPSLPMIPTVDTAVEIQRLGDRIARVSVTTPGSVTSRPFGEIADTRTFPLLTKWSATRDDLDDEETVKSVLTELDILFNSPTAFSRAMTSGESGGELRNQYLTKVEASAIKDLPKKSETALESNSLFMFRDGNGAIDRKFLPGQDRSVYTTELPHTDDDLINWEHRRNKFGDDFPAEFRQMTEQVRRYGRTSDSTSTVVYGNKAYSSADIDELITVARKDLMGFLKRRQLDRILGDDAPGPAITGIDDVVVAPRAPQPGGTPPAGDTPRSPQPGARRELELRANQWDRDAANGVPFERLGRRPLSYTDHPDQSVTPVSHWLNP